MIKNIKNQKGFAQLLMVLVLLLVVSLGLLAYVFVNKNKTDTLNTGLPTSAENVPAVKSQSDLVKMDEDLKSADFSTIDNTLDQNSKDATTF